MKQAEAGATGAGIEAPLHVKGAVYREGNTVQGHFGQFFKAVKDTAADLDDAFLGTGWHHRLPPNWSIQERLTNIKPAISLLKILACSCTTVRKQCLLLAVDPEGKRGEKGLSGKDGSDGKHGEDGLDGIDGSTVEVMELKGTKMVMVERKSSGDLVDHEVDLSPMLDASLEISKAFGEQQADAQIEIVKDFIRETYIQHSTDPDAMPIRFFRGRWFTDVAFKEGDCVIYGNELYLATEDSEGAIPRTSFESGLVPL